MIAHNMNGRQADPKFVKAITTNPDLETLFLSAGASGIGVSLTDLNRSYLVQYSDNLADWKTANSIVTGTGELIEWLDDGPPKTDVHPALVSSRVYRVVHAP